MYVFHISIDGLRSDTIVCLGEILLPTLYKIRKNGLFTDNARTDCDITITLPNHTGMFTSLPFKNGHNVYFNKNMTDLNIHDLNNKYIYSLFNNLYENKKTSAMYVNKDKFEFINKSYSLTDNFLYQKTSEPYITKFYLNKNAERDNKPIPIISELLNDIYNNKLCDYTFIHFGNTDKMGHRHGWNTDQYKKALVDIDLDIGILINYLESRNINFYMIITTDHGGGGGNIRSHSDITNRLNFTIPFYVYKNKGFNLGTNDLYSINKTRTSPKIDINPDYNDNIIPIRNNDTGNFVLYLLNIGPIKNSLVNYKQDLIIPK